MRFEITQIEFDFTDDIGDGDTMMISSLMNTNREYLMKLLVISGSG